MIGGEDRPTQGRRSDDRADASGTDLTQFAGHPLRFMLHYVRRRPRAHFFVLLAVLAAVGCSVGSQYAIKTLVDVLSSPDAKSLIWWAFVFLALLIAADNLLWRVAGWIGASMFPAVTGDLRRDLFDHLTGHSPRYFADRLPGTLASRITATSNAVFQVENMFCWNVLPPCVAVIGAILILVSVNPLMGLGLVAISAAMAFIIARLAIKGGGMHHEFAAKAAAVDGELIDVIGNMSLVRAFGAIGRERRRFSQTVEMEVGARERSLKYLEKLRLLHAIMTAGLTAVVLAWSIILWEAGKVTTGDVVLTCTLGFTIMHGTRDLAVALVDVTQHVARLAEAVTTLLVPHDLPDHPKATVLASRRGQVTFDHVTFNYPNGGEVMRDFCLDIPAGQKVGLIGRSGAGKSTVIALLQRFYDVDGGRIMIDGQEIKLATQESLRATIAIVPQDVSLFQRSIMENIRYGRPDASDEDVMEAARAASAFSFIEGLQDGFDTEVGERGTKLSGGQRQRIAIARAFLKDAPILILDEATSALDSESESQVQEALERLVKGRTVIAIAHRLSTLRNFDRIVSMDKGHVIEDGSPLELMHRPGLYRELLDLQAGRQANPSDPRIAA
ncbi:ATP-binding cassette, subfamily B [Arboricoccus pini]|uniref:ATP-binding cassette, subfamily B n=1 Tax=Arboricoccus pini TaxID=1963835 RepID=A0A212QPR3_9PROT|nr:ABC transporter ATP-binding protein [Arboricoccus pini]SNB61425.1 ATP-binding cassette, subfamily B [Arboricoccus pini]